MSFHICEYRKLQFLPDDEDESARGNEHVGGLLNHAGLRELLDKSKDNFYIIARSNEQIGGLLDHAGLWELLDKE